MTNTHKPAQNLPVYLSTDMRVKNGANFGDAIGFAEELVLDDIYALSAVAERKQLTIHSGMGRQFEIAPTSKVGTPGATLHLDSCVTLMTSDGQTTEVIVLVEVDDTGNVEDTYIFPLAHLDPDLDYVLVGINQENARRKFAQVACVSFTRGTRITMVSGAQTPIEDLRVGDRVLTRDDGPQEIRWIGQTTVRAAGDFSPIVIHKGALNNVNDLVVSPDHRLFIYQRTDTLGAGRSEVLVKARHLVNGTTVTRQKGGFVDYFQLLFDDHQIIYAEGIAAESMLVDTRTQPVLPKDIGAKITQSTPGSNRRVHAGFEVGENLMTRTDTAELLRRASTR